MSQAVVAMDTFKWVVSGLMGALLIGAGWLLSDIRTDLCDVRKDVSALRIEAAAAGRPPFVGDFAANFCASRD